MMLSEIKMASDQLKHQLFTFTPKGLFFTHILIFDGEKKLN